MTFAASKRVHPLADTAVTFGVGHSLAYVEREYIEATVEYYDGNNARAAAALGIAVKTLYNKLHLWEHQ